MGPGKLDGAHPHVIDFVFLCAQVGQAQFPLYQVLWDVITASTVPFERY